MAYQVAWLPGAIDDLDAIASYVAADSPTHAAAVVERMLACAADLALFPYSFSRVSEWDDDTVRQRIVYSYRLIFRIWSAMNTVEVLAIVHGARMLSSDVRERI